MDENWKNLEDTESFAFFMAELVDISPESFTLEEKMQILENMWKTSSDIENGMREDFAKLDEVSQTKLLDGLGASGYRGRDWWYRMFMDEPRHRDKPTI